MATGFLDEPAREALDAIGVDVVLSRPYTLRELAAALRSVLHTRASGANGTPHSPTPPQGHPP